MKPRVIASALLCSATLLSVAVPAVVQASTTAPSTSITAKAARQVTLPTSFGDFKPANGQLTDAQNQFKTINLIGHPQVNTTSGIAGNVLKFDGSSAYSMPVSDAQYAHLTKGMALETTFRYDPKASTSGEHDILSNQNSGGVGLGIENGEITFFAHVDGGYKQPTARLKAGQWIHAVGVIDQQAKTVNLYINGQLAESIKVPAGQLKFANNAPHFVLGGDSASGGRAESMMTGEVKTARIYDHALSANDVTALSNAARADFVATPTPTPTPEANVEQTLESRLVGADSVATGHTYDLDVHTRQQSSGDIDQISYTVNYDADRFEYLGANQLMKHVTVQQIAPGQLKVTDNAPLSGDSFKHFAKTRLARLQLKAKPLTAGNTTSTKISFSHGVASIQGKTVKNPQFQFDGQKAVTIHAQRAHDFNGDGIIGAGDVALAPKDQQAAVAEKAVIRPYKHVIVLTTDGGGNPWDPNGMYYAEGTDSRPHWTTNPAVLAKRTNTYTMDLFNKQFAMSTSAHSVVPSISAQNYISMLHGLPWGTMPSEYRADNSRAGQEYFADFDKTTDQFPSVFKVLQAANPTQGGKAFAEWSPILNGIIEPDAAVSTKISSSLKSFQDVADYIGQPEFNNTALTYMQSDYMDHTGHTTGFYNDIYWGEYAKYDALFKSVMDKLISTGHIHDTLVIANADHGGLGRGHGQDTTQTNTNIFMALGGETVDNGRRLKGGSNADISSLVLNALNVAQPASMTGEVFDSSAFLDQTDLAKKHRDVEAITLTQATDHANLSLKTRDHQLKTADLRIDLAGRTLDQVKLPKGTTLLRKTVKGNTLTLTVSFDKQPTAKVFAKLTFKDATTKADAKVMVKQAMVGTAQGNEILVDLFNETAGQKPDAGNETQKPEPGTDGNTQTPKPGTDGNTQTPKPGTDGNVPTPKPDTDSNTQTPKPGTDGNVQAPKPGTNDNTQTPKPGTDSNTQTPKPDTDNNIQSPKPGTDGNVQKPQTPSTKPAKHLYATGKLGFYKSTHFTKSTLHRWFKAAKQNLWPRFSLLNRVHTKDGYRYKVKDLNRKSKTFNKVGYITTNKRLVTATEYTGKVTRVKVIAPKGLNSFRDKGLSKKASHYNAKAKLSVKRIVKDGQHVRLQLSNGTYVTADKHQVQVMH